MFEKRYTALKLQACRKYMYTNSSQGEQEQKQSIKVKDQRESRQYLIQLMSGKDSRGLSNGDDRLLEEVEMFFRTVSVEDDR